MTSQSRCETWLIHICDITILQILRAVGPTKSRDSSANRLGQPDFIALWIHGDFTSCHSHASNYLLMLVTWLIQICDTTHWFVRHDSLICVTWLICMCDTTHSNVWYDTFARVAWIIHIDLTDSYVWRDSFVYVIWLLYAATLSRIWMKKWVMSHI